VPASGGEAVALTDSQFYSTRPVWSPDGERIAFASKVHGNLDVFILPASGGEVRRLTYHSADDRPYAFSADGKLVYFSSPRLGDPHSIHAGTYHASDQLYSVPAKGGRPRLVIAFPALDVSVDPKGRYLLYDNRPMYENEWRKGARSDGIRDIWQYDLEAGTHLQRTEDRGEDRDAFWAPDGKGFYFLSERDGSSKNTVGYRNSVCGLGSPFLAISCRRVDHQWTTRELEVEGSYIPASDARRRKGDGCGGRNELYLLFTVRGRLPILFNQLRRSSNGSGA
jgi:Tol biopolymer transport system component